MASERQPEKYPPGYEPPRQVSVEEYLQLEATSKESPLCLPSNQVEGT